ncbi:hypothetical protein PENSPDRAFT_611424 [Peniophora sp. CONT]|nr:hypothetical protein PENSPDRAFT_611424 [Peniophora sp. CONT]
MALYERFICIGELDDIDASLTASCCAVELASDDHPEMPSLLSNYGVSFQTRFKSLGQFEDIESSIAILRRADELMPDEHPAKPICSNNLGISLLSRFDITGEFEDLEDAITSHRSAVDHTPDGHPDKPERFSGLGNSFLARFERTGELEDIEQAILTHRRAVELTPDGHADKPSYFTNMGNSFLRCYERTGESMELEQAILGHRRAVQLTPDGHSDKPSRLNNLGSSLLRRFERTGELEDIEHGILSHRQAVELTPDGHPGKPAQFNNLGNSFLARFARTGEMVDLEQAISTHRRAVELTPDGHPDKPSLFVNLGSSLSGRFELTGKLEDLEPAISTYRRALELTADEYPQKPSMLRNLCYNLCNRFEQTQELADIQEAISAGERAIELSPEGHPGLFGHYSAFSLCFRHRFKHSGDIDDITKAISLLKKAKELITEGDPWVSGLLENLGSAQVLLFTHSQAQSDFDAAIESFTMSTSHSYGSSSIRFKSAKRCVRLLYDHPSFTTTNSLLSAHSRIIAILPEIVWLGHGIDRRYEESSQLGVLVNAAVSAAIAAGALTQAVEWLDAGRALIWAQVLSLRTPLDELRASRPDLADLLQSVQARLQSSASSAFALDRDTFGRFAGITVSSSADRHRKAVIEYDNLMKKIRASPGFENFLRPKTIESLIAPSRLLEGPVVFINFHASRCDALILCPGGSLTSVALPDLSLRRVSSILALWLSELKAHAGRARGLVPAEQMRGYLNPFTLVLEQLWIWIVGPILEALDLAAFTENDRLPHLTWCPTGPLVYLPLHAAGLYNQPFGPRVFDFVVSSYTPSLTTVLRACESVATAEDISNTKVLLVTQPATPGHSRLPGTARESAGLQRVLAFSHIETTVLDDKDATVSAVQAAMPQHPWIHLACHGTQDVMGDPTQGAFLLQDGRLSLTDLMSTVSGNAEVAFLSACQTAVGNLKNPEESAHLAAGMLAVGFKGVVGTTWSIRDDDAPVVVEVFYKELLALRSAGTLGKGGTGAAYALHEATRVLREQVGENSFLRWVPFVHFGV